MMAMIHLVEILDDFLELIFFIFRIFSTFFFEISVYQKAGQPTQPKVRLELKNPETPQGQVADLALAPLRMWTKSPWWDQMHSWI